MCIYNGVYNTEKERDKKEKKKHGSFYTHVAIVSVVVQHTVDV